MAVENISQGGLSAEACFDLAKQLLKLQQLDDALRLFTRALPPALVGGEKLQITLDDIRAFSPDVSMVLMGRGRVYQLTGKHKEAVADFDDSLKYLTSSGNSATEKLQRCRIFLLRGTSHAECKRYDLALKDFEAASKLNPADTSVYTGKAKLYMALQQFEPAVHNCTIALKRDPMNAVAYQYLGIIYAQLNQLKEALVAFDRALMVKPHYETFVLRGKTYTALGDPVKAVQDFTCAIELQPSLAIAYGNRAALCAQMGRLDLAIEDATRWISGASGEEVLSAYQARGVWLAQLGRYLDAVEDFSKVIESDPSHVLARNSRATAYAHLGMHRESVNDWLAVVDVQPDWPKAFLHIATEYSALHDYAHAVQFYTKAIKHEPKSIAIYRKRADAFSRLSLHDRALMDLSFALKLDPSSIDLYQLRAYEYGKLNQFDKGISDINSAILLDPINASNYEKRSALFWKMGKPHYGRTDLLQAKRLRRKLAHQAYLAHKAAKAAEAKKMQVESEHVQEKNSNIQSEDSREMEIHEPAHEEPIENEELYEEQIITQDEPESSEVMTD